MDSRDKYLKKIRSMGILRKESEMPVRVVKEDDQIGKSIKKSGRKGFEPVSSQYAGKLYRDYLSKGQRSFEYDPENPTETLIKKLEKIEKNELKEKYKNELKKIIQEKKKKSV